MKTANFNERPNEKRGRLGIQSTHRLSLKLGIAPFPEIR